MPREEWQTSIKKITFTKNNNFYFLFFKETSQVLNTAGSFYIFTL